ncbi:MAG: ABC transporter permease [Thermoanaerobacteraceae bacterium]|nr:ABC transporter permease [Thermoanaerobacteraceae bacterium]
MGKKSPTGLEKYLLPLLTVTGLLGIWQLVAWLGIWKPYELPAPSAVVTALVELAGQGILWEHIGISLYRFFIAYLVAAVLAIVIGLILGWNLRLHAAFDPLIQILRPISPIAWFPLAVIWFGIGTKPALFIIFMSVFFPVLLATITAVRNIDPLYIKVARNFGATEQDILRKVAIPAAFPNIMVGLQIGLATGWIHLVAGEMVGSQSGLGYMIIDARNFLRTDVVMGGMFIIGGLGLLLSRTMSWLERRVGAKWGFAPREEG